LQVEGGKVVIGVRGGGGRGLWRGDVKEPEFGGGKGRERKSLLTQEKTGALNGLRSKGGNPKRTRRESEVAL